MIYRGPRPSSTSKTFSVFSPGGAEIAEGRDDPDRYVLPGLICRIAEDAIGWIKDDVLDPEAGKPTVHLIVVQAFKLTMKQKPSPSWN
ncbi:hypothetical protein ACIPN8_42665 [Streptomyces sp. NPDC086082]|uniref:hypothetical protein n=1 Tax=Streptomyces sp. NPDC086082 TaxID=3365750 RepID=UPI0037F760CB